MPSRGRGVSLQAAFLNEARPDHQNARLITQRSGQWRRALDLRDHGRHSRHRSLRHSAAASDVAGGDSLRRRFGAARRVRRLARVVDIARRDGNERRRLQPTFSLVAWR
jgi:hypothetical protein